MPVPLEIIPAQRPGQGGPCLMLSKHRSVEAAIRRIAQMVRMNEWSFDHYDYFVDGIFCFPFDTDFSIVIRHGRDRYLFERSNLELLEVDRDAYEDEDLRHDRRCQ
jgi:hypothetical protein